jgi:leucyl aminopeptidase
VVALPVHPYRRSVRPDAASLDLLAQLGVDAPAQLKAAGARGRAGEVTAVPSASSRAAAGKITTVLLVGVGDASTAALRRAAAAAVRASAGRRRLGLLLTQTDDAAAHVAAIEAAVLAGYRFRRPGTGSTGTSPVGRIDVWGATPDVVAEATVTAEAVALARDLANAPANEIDPSAVAEQASDLADRAGLVVTVLDDTDLAAGGFGGLVGVGAGSAKPPRLVRLDYRPAGATRHVALVGKGITFDSGGLSLKPAGAMLGMHTDMAAAAAVLATMSALAARRVPVAVTGLLALAENMPSGTAMRPGDVITQFGGRTTEVLNTDAEGRLVLADVLAYAVAELRPDVVVDLATLTGAIGVALGRSHAGLFATDDAVAEELVVAGQRSGEPVWRMPLDEDYRAALDSPIADQANVSRDSTVGGGAGLAALFLRPFAGRTPWAHLDIAAMARSDADRGEVSRGGTGFGVRLLLAWLADDV